MENKVLFDFHYNEEDDVLTIFDYSKPISETIEFSEVLNISVGKEGLIVGFEIFDAAKFLSTLNSNLNKVFLNELIKVELEQQEYRNNFFVVIWLYSKNKVISQQLPIMPKSTFESPLIASVM